MGTYGATTRYNHDKCRRVLVTFMEEFPFNVPFIMDDVMDYIVPLPGHMLKDVQPTKSTKIGKIKKNRYQDSNFFSQLMLKAVEDYWQKNKPCIVVRGRWQFVKTQNGSQSTRVFIKLKDKKTNLDCFDCGLPIDVDIKFNKKGGDVSNFNRTFTCSYCYGVYCGRDPRHAFLLTNIKMDEEDYEEDNDDDNWLDELMIMEDDENGKS
tara:strand:+ start:10859 stop:11482 length:624 start_codon:yes stop_codon:yes gene_type:complete